MLANPQSSQAQRTFTVALAATFTAEPLEAALNFWMQELGMPSTIEFAPYNQIFQQLLDPFSLLAQNQSGVNILLLRFEDWRRDISMVDEAETAAKVERNLEDLLAALKAAVGRSSTPYLVCLCPDSPSAKVEPNWHSFTHHLENRLVAELGGISGLYLVREADLELYPTPTYYDSERDKLGHIPFTPVYFSALATLLARRIYALKNTPHKVIVLDCDNTIWKGVVGEDGITGIEFTPGYRALQEFMIAQQQAGMVLCFCSKNNEADVLEVFEQRPEMPLKREHLVGWRINWLPKSQNIQSLAQELNLGLDSFIFIDDNPMECAEVQEACPEVLTLQLPIHGDIPNFLNHVWAFDHLKVTEEDKQRTALYQQNLERSRLQQEAPSIEEFLAKLELRVDITEPDAAQLPRVAQLTQRTNQFNFSTIRRSDSEIQQLAEAGLECRIVQVSDRFGEYGLVGVVIFKTTGDALEIDTFLLSCRVLGRGVEHRMLSHLGQIARGRNLPQVKVTLIRSKKNAPALNFLESAIGEFKQPIDNGLQFTVPVEFAAALDYNPAAESITAASPPEAAKEAAETIALPTASVQSDKSKRLYRIATELHDAAQILEQIEAQPRDRRPDLTQAYVAPRTEVEQKLSALWAELLHLDTVGIQDNYFDLGGTSLLSVELFAQVDRTFGKKLPLTALLEAPTIEKMATLITRSDSRDSLVLIRSGGPKPTVFLIHDGDGETLLYRNLAQRLNPDHAVYGLQPHSHADIPMLHTRISDMAAHHIDRIRSVQPQGPYLLGGMCAGGVIAYEVARQLEQQGQTVAMVALLDAADVDAPKRVGRIANQRLKNFSGALNQSSQVKSHQRGLMILGKIWQKGRNLVVYETRTRFNRIWNKVRLRLFQYYVDRHKPIPKFLRQISVRTAYLFAESNYAPTEPYSGELALFRATDGGGPDEPYLNIYSDPLLGWGKRTHQPVRVYDVPGGHSSMLQEPHVEAMAETMQAYIDGALAGTTAPQVLALSSSVTIESI
ncbi:MAG TPA: HAD-IIIC family phosphatase [Thermosynechococcaceae cyanobacterium]